MERISGVSMTNFSRGGMTAFHMYQEADKQNVPNADICWLVCKDYSAYSEDAASHQVFPGNNAR